MFLIFSYSFLKPYYSFRKPSELSIFLFSKIPLPYLLFRNCATSLSSTLRHDPMSFVSHNIVIYWLIPWFFLIITTHPPKTKSKITTTKQNKLHFTLHHNTTFHNSTKHSRYFVQNIYVYISFYSRSSLFL